MKRFLTILLCTTMLFAMAACQSSAPATSQPIETTEEMKPVDTYPYPAINDKLTRQNLEALPVKSENMTVQEMREACVAFMRFSKTALWTPNDYLQYERNTSGAMDEIVKGNVYAGLPYIGRGGCGNVYRLLDYIDEETGVLDMEEPAKYPALFGNHCSSCTYWAWGRVISSVEHAFTANISHKNGYLRIGPYTYKDSEPKFSANYTSDMICAENGMDIMCQSYAQLHLADGLVNYHAGGGHVIMASSEPHIEYYEGKIDPAASYITVLEQAANWVQYTNEAGDVAQIKPSVDKKMTFLELFGGAYMPFTFAEFLGTKAVDKTECSINLSGDSVDATKLFNAKVTSNFGISDIYVTLKNADGKVVYRLVTRATNAGEKQVSITRNGTNAFATGDFDKLSGEYAVEVTAQLSTGERPVLYAGKVII